MVDTISNAKGIRPAGSATTRYGAPPASSDTTGTKAVAPVSASGETAKHDQDGQSEQDAHRDAMPETDGPDLRLEVREGGDGKELVYCFVDVQTGQIVRKWSAGEFGKLRDYVRDKKIHLLDKKV